MSWYVVQSHPHKEHVASQHLTHQGFVNFLPMLKRTVRRGKNRFHMVAKPMFPGYLFVSLDIERQRWRTINSTLSVRRIICHGDKPSPLPPGVVEALVQNSDQNGIVSTDGNHLQTGVQVEMLTGPFAGLIGELAALNSQGRIKILLQLLSGTISIYAHQRDVMPIHTGSR